MDISQGAGAKGIFLLIFIVSVLVWLITITAVFQIRINETSGLEAKIAKETLPKALAILETRISDKTVPGLLSVLEARISGETIPGALAGLKAKINGLDAKVNDPCSGVMCEGGFTASENHGICECICGSSADKAVAYAPFTANVCDNGAPLPSVKCGVNDACDDYTEKPFCLDKTGVTSGFGVIPSPGSTVPEVTCQCNAHHHCHAHKTPFCGTGESAAHGNANHVPVGQCGKCQVKAAGGGGFSVIDQLRDTGPGDGRAAPTSCGSGNVCCKTGECVPSHDHCSTR